MQLPEKACVRLFQEVLPGSLVIGRFTGVNRNYTAVRAVISDVPHLVVFPDDARDGKGPHLLEAPVDVRWVLDLGAEWFVDVEISDRAPIFDEPNPEFVLAHCDGAYFLHCKSGRGAGEYVNLSDGVISGGLPSTTDQAFWSSFSFKMPQPNNEPPVEVFRWPMDSPT